MILHKLLLDIRQAIIDRLLRSFQNLVVDEVDNLIYDNEILCRMLSLGVIEVELREVGDVYLFTEEAQDLLVDIIHGAIGNDEYPLFERLAAIEHERWSKWQEYLHSKCKRSANGDLVISAEYVKHLERQINTPYSDLTEKEKDSDRQEVEKYWNLINNKNW